MGNRLVFSNAGTDKQFAFKYVNDTLDEIEYFDEESIIDNIYLGVVDSVAKGINASFVIFDGNKKGFLLNEKEQPLFINKKNTDKICQGDKFPIQVKNDRIKTKDYSLTCNLSLKSENLIIFLQENNISISKKISDSKRRENIRNLLKSNFPDYGFLVRTSAAKLEDEAIFNEASNLVKRLVDLLAKSRYATGNERLFQAENEKIHCCNEFLKKYKDATVICNSRKDYMMLSEYYKNKRDSEFIHFYKDEEINLLFNVNRDLADAVKNKVWLKSGAYLVIEPTEALNVIDVNSGKALKKGDREKCFFDINIEAADRICLEIKRRNLSGIIIIDFINMKSKEYNDELIRHLEKLALNDSVTLNVHGFTKLGLVEITRKKIKKQLHELDLERENL